MNHRSDDARRNEAIFPNSVWGESGESSGGLPAPFVLLADSYFTESDGWALLAVKRWMAARQAGRLD
jgi:hypothetical protein